MMPAVKWFVLAAAVAILDQVTKHVAVANMSYGQQVEVFSWFNWTLLYNTGAAFSFLADAGGWQRWFFVVLTIAISAVLSVWLVRLKDTHVWLSLGIALVIGGALGNLYDRALMGYVVDFIQWHYDGWYWPAFNVADMAICAGGAILIIDGFFESKREEEK